MVLTGQVRLLNSFASSECISVCLAKNPELQPFTAGVQGIIIVFYLPLLNKVHDRGQQLSTQFAQIL
jgi:hypothetical protein